MTLVFLGGQEAGEAEAIAEAAFAALPAGVPGPLLTPVKLRVRPRLLALDLDDSDGRATALHEAAASALEAGGWYERERRPFWPHVTLARARGRRGRIAKLGGPAPPRAPLRVPAVTLYRSRPGREGARYEPLARLGLSSTV